MPMLQSLPPLHPSLPLLCLTVQTEGLSNTVRRHAPTAHVHAHTTPFPLRVESELRCVFPSVQWNTNAHAHLQIS